MEWINIQSRKPELAQTHTISNGKYIMDVYFALNGEILENTCCGDKIDVSDATHWLDITLPNQPERSKREDLDCCKEVEELENALDDLHWEFCGYDNESLYDPCNNRSCIFIRKLLQETKMRCSEHKG